MNNVQVRPVEPPLKPLDLYPAIYRTQVKTLAWESVLIQVLARLYANRERPFEALEEDQASLSGLWKSQKAPEVEESLAQDVAAEIEEIYKGIKGLLEQEMEWRLGGDERAIENIGSLLRAKE